MPWIGQQMDFPAEKCSEAGILETPELLVCGGIFAADVFAKPSMARKQLALDVTLRNPCAQEVKARLEVAIEPEGGGTPERTFAAQEVTLAPDSEHVVALGESWASPRLWWPDSPQLYRAVTRVTVARKTGRCPSHHLRLPPVGLWQPRARAAIGSGMAQAVAVVHGDVAGGARHGDAVAAPILLFQRLGGAGVGADLGAAVRDDQALVAAGDEVQAAGLFYLGAIERQPELKLP
jgi:hypothetical protein